MKGFFDRQDRHISLRGLVFTTIGPLVGLFTVIFISMFLRNILTILHDSEIEQIRTKSEIIKNAINAQTSSAQAFAQDWASWDETYDFAIGRNPGHMSKYWTEDWKIDGQKYNFIFVKDMGGKDLFVKYYDYFAGENIPVPEGFSEELWGLSSKFLEDYCSGRESGSETEAYRDGFVFIGGTAYYVCVRPILTFDEKSEPAGAFIIGRVFDYREIERVTGAEGLVYNVFPSDDPRLEEMGISVGEHSAHAQPSDGTIAVFMPLPGFVDGQQVVLEAERQRDLYQGAMRLIGSYGLVLLLVVAAFVGLVYYVIEVYLLRPIEQLSLSVSAIDDSGGSAKLYYGKGKELYSLAESIDDMLTRLNHSRQNLSRSTVSINIMQRLLNVLDTYLFVTDIDTDEILFINDKMREHFKLGDVVGMPCYDVMNQYDGQRCDFCVKRQLLQNPGKPIEMDTKIDLTGRHYRKVDLIIDWLEGKKAHLQYYVDITEHKIMEESFIKRFQRQSLLASVSQSFVANDDTEMLINNALQMTGEIIGAHRVLLCQYNKEAHMLITRYELFSVFPPSMEGHVKEMPFKEGGYLYDLLMENNFFTVAINDTTDSGYEEVKSLGLKSSLVIPVNVMGDIWGILEFDKNEICHWTSDDVYYGSLIGNIISGAFTRQSAEEKMSVISDFFRIIQNPIFELTTDNCFKLAYSEDFTFAGYTMPELKDKNLREFLTPLDYEALLIMLESAVKEHTHLKEIQCQVLCKNGEVWDYTIDILPIYDSYGTCTALRCSYTDITEKMNSERELLRMSALIESSPQYISYINATGQYEFVNPAASEVTGYSYEELLSRGFYRLHDEGTARKLKYQLIPQALDYGRASFELPLIKKNGDVRTMSYSAFTITTDKRSVGIIASDVTDGKRLERELTKAKEMAEKASRAKGEFLSRMSHEMRTPMNAIIGMTSIAKSSNDIGKKEYCLDKIDSASKHLLGVINDILDMSKIEANKFELSYSEFDIEKMLMNVTGIISFRAEERHQTLSAAISPGVPATIIGDEQRLSQVITNLLSNSIKFTPDNGKISLTVEAIAEEKGICTIQVTVEDTGIGISPEQQAHLFTSFEQADGGIARKYGGTGLGLVISKNIVELMGGKIWIESQLGQGSRFIFYIKAKKGKERVKPTIASDINKDNLRVLAVDDSPVTRDYFAHIMEGLGLPCVVAESGNEAIRLVEENKDNPFNLFFVDWIMPDMNGVELAHEIRNHSINNPIIIMISIVEWSEIEGAAAAGVNGFVPKPLFPSKIVDTINKCLGAYTAESKIAAPTPKGGEFSGHRLLLAEDMEVNREIIAALLEDTGVVIDYAQNGLEALNMFSANPRIYSLILMDIHMPEMDGYEAVRNIRGLNIKEAKEIPILAMTANVFKEDVDMCLAVGMNDHIGKPISIEELMGKLSKYLLRGFKSPGSFVPVEVTPAGDADYSQFMPAIDVENGMERLRGNAKLYFTLLKNFKGREMTGELIKQLKERDFANAQSCAHALKGLASNLGLVELERIVTVAESQARERVLSMETPALLEEAVNSASLNISRLLEREGMK